MDFRPGDRVDRFVLLEPLGEGGQGAVWKADDITGANKVRALKLVPIAKGQPTQLERVRREARALAELSHASLVRCHSLFEDFENGVLGLVLDLVPGASLGAALGDPRFTTQLRTKALLHVALALAYLHERALIHRDLKLENVLITDQFWQDANDPSGVKLVDFGIAAFEGNPSPLTAIGHIVGTPPYMAPELLDPTHFGKAGATPAADVFAFGVVAWRMLVGGHPTGLPPESTLVDYATEYRRASLSTPEWTTRLPAGPYGRVLADCLEPNVSRRLQNGGELATRWKEAERATRVQFGEGPTIAARTRTEESTGPAATPHLEPTDREVGSSVAPRTEAMHGPPAVYGTGQPKRGSRSTLWPLLLVLFGLLSCVLPGAIIALVNALDKPAPSAPTGPHPSVALPTPGAGTTQARPASSAPTTLPFIPDPGRPKACSANDDLCACCASGHDCSPGACSDLLRPGESFDLRIWSLVPSTPSIATPPDAEVCVRRLAFPLIRNCAQIGDTYGGKAATALRVTTEDLTRTGLLITTRRKGGDVGSKSVSYTAIHRSALCQGLEFGGIPGDFGHAKFYLDPVGVRPSRSCQSDPARSALSVYERGDVGTNTSSQWSTECFIQLNNGNYGWARAACKEGLAAAPAGAASSSLLYNAGLVERAYGRNADARDYFRKSLMKQEAAEVRRALNALEP